MEKIDGSNELLELLKTVVQSNKLYNNYLADPTLKNYIEVKKSIEKYKALLVAMGSVRFDDEVVNDTLSKTDFLNFKTVKSFEEIIKLREEREQVASRTINFLQHYEKCAHLEGKKLKCCYSAIFMDFIEHLDDIELSTRVGNAFPQVSYKKLPTPSQSILSKIKKLENYDIEMR